MSKFDALRANDYLCHILEAIDRIRRYVNDMTKLTSPAGSVGFDVHHAQSCFPWVFQSGLRVGVENDSR